MRLPVGEDRERSGCTSCGAIHYENPRMVVGCIIEEQGQILLCKRAIQPRYGPPRALAVIVRYEVVRDRKQPGGERRPALFERVDVAQRLIERPRSQTPPLRPAACP